VTRFFNRGDHAPQSTVFCAIRITLKGIPARDRLKILDISADLPQLSFTSGGQLQDSGQFPFEKSLNPGCRKRVIRR
jgi:hypothetical protein